MSINWNLEYEDLLKVERVVERGQRLFKGFKYKPIDMRMGVVACHLNGNPLDFDKLMLVPDSTFGHDLLGIRRYIDRTTGKLTDCFVPRCSK